MSRTESHLQRQTGILNDIKASVGKVTTGSPALSVPSVQNVGIFGSNAGTEWKPVEVSASGAMKVDLDLDADGISLEATQIEVRDRLPTAVTASGNLKVSIEEGAIPAITGFATEAKQDNMITDLGVIKGDTTSLDGKVIACDTGAVVVASSALPSGASSEAKQDDINTKLDTIINNTEKFAPSYSRTEALPVQLVCGSVGATYNSLRAIGQDLGVYIDDMNPDVAVSSGLSTSAKQGAGLPTTLTGSGNLKVSIEEGSIPAITGFSTEATLSTLNGKVTTCDTGAVVVASGAITETNSSAILSDTGSLDSKITACNTGAVVVSASVLPAGASSLLLQTLMNSNLGIIAGDTTSLDGKVISCNTGAVVVSSSALPSGASTEATQLLSQASLGVIEGDTTTMVASLGVIEADTTSLDAKILVGNDDDLTTSQQVLAYGKGSDGDLHPLKVTPSGVVKTEEVLDWNTTSLLSVVAIAGGASGTTSTLDLGTEIHAPADITIYVINSAQVTSTIQAQSSPDGSIWYTSATTPLAFSTGRNLYFSLINNLGTPVGRYLRFVIANTSASSSNYSVSAGEYNGA